MSISLHLLLFSIVFLTSNPCFAKDSHPNKSKRPQIKTQPASPLYDTIFKLDRDYRVSVESQERVRRVYFPETLFSDLDPNNVHSSYAKTYQFIQKFNPMGRGHSEVPDEKINDFLKYVSHLKPLAYALKETNTTWKDLKTTWFGYGNGFEHVFSGEIKRPWKKNFYRFDGYHWWYTYYRDERHDPFARSRLVKYFNSTYGRRIPVLAGMSDPLIITLSFAFDPDGVGIIPEYRKKIGGFTTGNSVAALMAFGHLAFYNTKGRVARIRANINGREYTWVFAKDHNLESIVTLYPMK